MTPLAHIARRAGKQFIHARQVAQAMTSGTVENC
jgi:hypothetical protein